MELETLYLTERKEWRDWLQANFDKKHEVWLVYPNKSTGKPRIEYNTAVEEALCFGWIDSKIKSFDKDSAIQKYSVRREKSNYSQANKERLKWLLERDLIHPIVIPKVKEVLKNEFVIPQDIIDEIKKDKEAWEFYQTLTDGYKRIRIAYIDGARVREDIFQQRLKYFIKNTSQGKLIKGFGGIGKYY